MTLNFADGSNLNYSNVIDVVMFCNLRLDPKARTVIIRNGNGLSNAEELGKALSKGEYVPVLKAIWSEKDKQKRLTWLRENAGLNAPLMYELAIAEIVNSPLQTTVDNIAIPLFSAASFRALQDALCSADLSVSSGSGAGSLKAVYETALSDVVKKYNVNNTENMTEESKLKVANRKVIEISQRTLSEKLPPPNWIAYNGINVFLEGTISMHPEKEWSTIRTDYAKKTIQELS